MCFVLSLVLCFVSLILVSEIVCHALCHKPRARVGGVVWRIGQHCHMQRLRCRDGRGDLALLGLEACDGRGRGIPALAGARYALVIAPAHVAVALVLKLVVEHLNGLSVHQTVQLARHRIPHLLCAGVIHQRRTMPSLAQLEKLRVATLVCVVELARGVRACVKEVIVVLDARDRARLLVAGPLLSPRALEGFRRARHTSADRVLLHVQRASLLTATAALAAQTPGAAALELAVEWAHWHFACL